MRCFGPTNLPCTSCRWRTCAGELAKTTSPFWKALDAVSARVRIPLWFTTPTPHNWWDPFNHPSNAKKSHAFEIWDMIICAYNLSQSHFPLPWSFMDGNNKECISTRGNPSILDSHFFLTSIVQCESPCCSKQSYIVSSIRLVFCP